MSGPIFHDPAVQAVYEQFILGTVVGDYQKGAKAFLTRQPYNSMYPVSEPDVVIPKAFDEHWDRFQERQKTWEKGYTEAAQDPRFQVIHNLLKSLQQ